MTTVLIDTDAGNLHSAEKAFQRMAGETDAGPVLVSAEPEVVAGAERLVLPGDGAFAACMVALEARPALRAAMAEVVVGRGRPFLGICVGMQLLASRGLEHGVTEGLGWVPGEVAALTPSDPALKVPHMGWNDLVVEAQHPVLDGIATGDHAYFVHSYAFATEVADDRLAHADYGGPVTAIIGRGNVVGTQFHPEKSQRAGLRLIANFLRWRP